MFQTRLRELREAAGYKSQQAFADAFGVAQSTVGGWEAGKREPDYVTTTRLARFLGVPIGELVVPDEKKLSEKLSPRFMRRKELIERQNISYKELSEKTGISAQRLKRYFTSDSLGRIDFLDEFPKLARALGVSPQYLYCLTDDEANDKDTNQSFRDYVMEHSILRDYFKQQDVDTKKEPTPVSEDGPNETTQLFMSLVDKLTPEQQQLLLVQLQAWTGQSGQPAPAVPDPNERTAPESDS